ncbi:MAG: myo-inosose-2 dehydratase [Bauldia sp.]|nr:myo-inosose-2 dehydratase [Bauldia sp.]
MSARIGINPITWTNDDVPELGGDTSLETCLAETRAAGYLGTELGGKFPRDSAVLGPILAGHDLKLVGGWWDGRILDRSVEEEFEALLPHLTLHRDLGAPRVVYADTSRGRHGAIWEPISNRPTLADDEWAGYGRKVTALAEKMDDFGVGMAFHHHMGTVVESDAEVDRLMAVTGPAVGLLYDTGHSAFSGGDPVALVKRHAARIVHVHCKDTRPDVLAKARRDDQSFMQAVLDGIFTVPGDGSVDYPAILRHLHDAGYAGWLVVEAEQDPRKAHPLTYASLGYRNLVALAEGAGFVVETRESGGRA